MNLHEYQAKEILRAQGVNIPPGRVATTPAEAEAIAKEYGVPVMVKAQVHAGGRGKAGGVKFCKTPAEAKEKATAILGMKIKELTVEQVLVTVDEAQVRKVAEIGGGKFYRATDSESLRNIFSEIDQLEKVPVEAQRSRNFRELFFWPLGFGVALTAISLLWSLSLGRRLP